MWYSCSRREECKGVIVFQIILLFLWGQHRDKSSRRRALVEMLRWAMSRSVCQSVILASTGCGVHTGCGGCRERMGCCVGSKGGIGGERWERC